MKTEVNIFLAALMFYTRIPCPKWFVYEEHYLGQSRKYFPLIGWVVGGIGALVFWLSQLILPGSLAIILSMIATILATGAFHEDGFADSCDAFGGGWDHAQIMTIMKDSRIGTYGTVGIVLLLALKFCALNELYKYSDSILMITLIASHSLSRFCSSLYVQSHHYVQDIDKSKSKPIATTQLSVFDLRFSFIFVLMPLLFYFPNWIFLAAIVPVYLSKVYLASYFKRWIGGYTGDCLGAVQQVTEVVFYISILAICQVV